MKTNILPASDHTYTLAAGKLLEGMKIDQKNPADFSLDGCCGYWGNLQLQRGQGEMKIQKSYQSQVVLTVQDNLNLLSAGLLVLRQGTDTFLNTLISLQED